MNRYRVEVRIQAEGRSALFSNTIYARDPDEACACAPADVLIHRPGYRFVRVVRVRLLERGDSITPYRGAA